MKRCPECGGISGSFKGGFLSSATQSGVRLHRLRCMLIPRIQYSKTQKKWYVHFPSPLRDPARDVHPAYDEFQDALNHALAWNPGRLKELN